MLGVTGEEKSRNNSKQPSMVDSTICSWNPVISYHNPQAEWTELFMMVPIHEDACSWEKEVWISHWFDKAT